MITWHDNMGVFRINNKMEVIIILNDNKMITLDDNMA
jgi:hypothetical protein